MNFASYINWIINNPENFEIVRNKIIDKEKEYPPIYIIWHTNPDTGLKREVLVFKHDGDYLIDHYTNLQLVYLPNSILDMNKLYNWNNERN